MKKQLDEAEASEESDSTSDTKTSLAVRDVVEIQGTLVNLRPKVK